MKKILSLALLLLTMNVNAQMKFSEGSWADIKAKAKKENKMIFIDAYTTWCAPCKMLSRDVFPQKTVGDFYNDKYINFKMDMEKGEGIAFAQQYKVQAYPTLLYFNNNGEIAHQIVGAPSAEGLISVGQDALLPEKQYFTLLKRYEQGERNSEFLRNIASAATAANAEGASKLMEELLNVLPKEEWGNPENIDFVIKAVTSFDCEAFQYMKQNKDKFTEDYFQMAITPLIGEELEKIVEAKDEQALKVLQEKISGYLPQNASLMNTEIEKYFYQKSGNVQKIEANLANSTSWSELNEAAWNMYETEDDTEKLKKALEWAKKSIALEENYYNTDTYAHLLHKVGQNKTALTWANKALKLGKAENQDVKATENLIKKLKK